MQTFTPLDRVQREVIVSWGEQTQTSHRDGHEALCKVLCHNLCVVIQSLYELNITPEFMSEAA